nr:hypothetical protein [Tanacetum cinerariifolium]
DFLSGSYIRYALTVSHSIYISCIKQFWNSVLVKRLGDVTRLQALVDKKKIVISEAVIHEILQLNDAEGVVCLPNEEIFAGLAQMDAKRTSWNEFSTAMASIVICLLKGQRFNFSKYIFDSLVRNVDSSSKFYMYPRIIQLIIQTNIANLSIHTTKYISLALTQKVFTNMRRVGKGFSRVETPLFESMLVVRDVAEEAEAQVPAQGDNVQEPAVEEVVPEVVPPTPTSSSPPSPPYQPPCPPQPQDVEAAQQLEIVKLKARVKKLEQINKGRIIVDMDQDEGIELVADQEKDAEFEGRHADKQAEIYNIDLDHSSKVAAASTPIPDAKPRILTITVAPVVSTRRRKGVVIRDPEEELSSDTLAETPKVKDKGKGILIEAPKPMKKKDQIEMDAEYARK